MRKGVMRGRGHAAKRKEELPPEDSVLIRLLLHLLIASHWGCREISVACHHACRSDFSFTLLAYRCTIRTKMIRCVCVCVCLFKVTSHPFVSLSLTPSCTLQWKAVRVIGRERVAYELIKMSRYWLPDVPIVSECLGVCMRGHGCEAASCISLFTVFYMDVLCS